MSIESHEDQLAGTWGQRLARQACRSWKYRKRVFFAEGIAQMKKNPAALQHLRITNSQVQLEHREQESEGKEGASVVVGEAGPEMPLELDPESLK